MSDCKNYFDPTIDRNINDTYYSRVEEMFKLWRLKEQVTKERNETNLAEFLQQKNDIFAEDAKKGLGIQDMDVVREIVEKMKEERTQELYYQYYFSLNYQQEKAKDVENKISSEDDKRKKAVQWTIEQCVQMYEQRAKVYGVTAYFREKEYGKDGCPLTKEMIDGNKKYKWATYRY